MECPTLVTFFLETSPSTRSVSLLGSWDNFVRPYTMERDVRRHRGQWKGCHSFKNAGLKMGETYYFYYELDGTIETHDPSLPSTTACPSLPGQPVNTLYVPFEMSARKRSASLSSVRDCDYMTVQPRDKFVPTRAAPAVPELPACRLATSHIPSLSHKRSTRSLSPTPPWSWSPRRLFSRGRPSQKEGECGNVDADAQLPSSLKDDQRSLGSTQSARSRDISPDSLRRFLSDDAPLRPSESAVEEDASNPCLSIPEDIAEEYDDDDNFATTSAQSENAPVTVLSPPPSQRAFPSSSTLSRLARDSRPQTPAAPTRAAPAVPTLEPLTSRARGSHLSPEAILTPQSPESIASYGAPSFYFSDDDEDEDEDEDDAPSFMPLQGSTTTGFDAPFSSLISKFAGYTLPEAAVSDESKVAPATAGADSNSASDEVSVAPTSPVSVEGISGTSDLIAELRWMAPAILKA